MFWESQVVSLCVTKNYDSSSRLQCTQYSPSACLGSQVDLMVSQHVNSQLFFLSTFPFIYRPFIHLKVQSEEVEIVVM